jgi:hypothetical protein
MGYVVSLEPLNRVYEVMGGFCNPIGDELVELVALQRRSITTAKDRKKVSGIDLLPQSNVDEIELLTIFIQTVVPFVQPHQEHPVMTLFMELVPKIGDTLGVFGSDRMVSESVSKLFKNIICYGAHSLIFLDDMIKILQVAFVQWGYSSFLWVSGDIVKKFGYGQDLSIQSAIQNFVKAQCLSAIQLLDNKPNNDPGRTSHIV